MEVKIAIVGLGYVGLPLMVGLANTFNVTGFDHSAQRVRSIKQGVDRNLELTGPDAEILKDLDVSDNLRSLGGFDVYIICVPTPVDLNLNPDLSGIKEVSAAVGKCMERGAIIVFESTVFPGCTREVCIPILERESGLEFGKDFQVGYSPERINPGDCVNTLQTMVKLVAASDSDSANVINDIYSRVCSSTYICSSIEEAEFAKVLENTQRDVNIALMNEIAGMCSRMDISVTKVIEAAATKWNFLPFSPGLVGGHCIGVDPYYLAHKAKSLGVSPRMILAGRYTNEEFVKNTALGLLKILGAKSQAFTSMHVLLLGCSFKKNVSDSRNSKVFDIANMFIEWGLNVSIYDPLARMDRYNQLAIYNNHDDLPKGCVDAVILMVDHDILATSDLSWLEVIAKSDTSLIKLYSGQLRILESFGEVSVVYP